MSILNTQGIEESRLAVRPFLPAPDWHTQQMNHVVLCLGAPAVVFCVKMHCP